MPKVSTHTTSGLSSAARAVHNRRNIWVRSGVLMDVEGEDCPRPLGLVIVAIIAALLWSLVAPSLGADGAPQDSMAPAAVGAPSSGQRRGP